MGARRAHRARPHGARYPSGPLRTGDQRRVDRAEPPPQRRPPRPTGRSGSEVPAPGAPVRPRPLAAGPRAAFDGGMDTDTENSPSGADGPLSPRPHLSGWIGVVLSAPRAQPLAHFYRDLLGWPLHADEPDWCTMQVPGPRRIWPSRARSTTHRRYGRPVTGTRT
ncbi:VOC family protein [Brachybacterium sp. P6-10-X1]|uniref:VOC family protein n=1 Tax=Brachybacterium sp. P6-10-X1 TaxID=1903186 RepID=UPI00352B02B9